VVDLRGEPDPAKPQAASLGEHLDEPGLRQAASRVAPGVSGLLVRYQPVWVRLEQLQGQPAAAQQVWWAAVPELLRGAQGEPVPQFSEPEQVLKPPLV
jgi:hypothetical protein